MTSTTRKTLKLERIGDKVYVTPDRGMAIAKIGGKWQMTFEMNDHMVTYEFATLADARLAGRTFYGM